MTRIETTCRMSRAEAREANKQNPKLVIPLFITIEEQRDVHQQKAIRRTRGNERCAGGPILPGVWSGSLYLNFYKIVRDFKEH